MQLMSLKNHLLLAMPQMPNPHFQDTVLLVCQHDASGGIGVIINRLTQHSMGEIFEQLALQVARLELTDQPVFAGGPVNPELGLVVHADGKHPSFHQDIDTPLSKRRGKTTKLGHGHEHEHEFEFEPEWESSLEIGDGLWVTSSRDILGSIASGQGPQHAIMLLGHAGWAPGQLEYEIQQNWWFYTPADHSIIFNSKIDTKWRQAAQLLGIDSMHLARQIGHA